MPKLSSYRRIITNDFEEEDEKLVEQLASPINDSFNELYFAANGRLSIRENLYCTYKEFDVTVASSGAPTARTVIKLIGNVPVLGVQVLYAANQVNTGIYPTGTPFISFSQNNDTIIINNITNLQADQLYKIRLIVWH